MVGAPVAPKGTTVCRGFPRADLKPGKLRESEPVQLDAVGLSDVEKRPGRVPQRLQYRARFLVVVLELLRDFRPDLVAARADAGPEGVLKFGDRRSELAADGQGQLRGDAGNRSAPAGVGNAGHPVVPVPDEDRQAVSDPDRKAESRLVSEERVAFIASRRDDLNRRNDPGGVDLAQGNDAGQPECPGNPGQGFRPRGRTADERGKEPGYVEPVVVDTPKVLPVPAAT